MTAKEDAPIYGCAIDIGTTTVTGVLMDLASGKLVAKASAGNGQIRYGADVINRIIEQGKPGGVKRLQDAILKETLRPMVGLMCKTAGITADRIFRVAIASNTTMNHLLLGVDANPVRMEPYIPTFFQWRGLVAKDLAFPRTRTPRCSSPPNIGSYVGGDITAGALTSLIWDKDEFSLFIDLGTNGELVFGNRDFMMSCACSAGPAFEGGDISCGMRATDGAVEAVVIDKDTMEPTLSIVGDAGQKPVGICGSGIIDVIAELYRTSIISAKGQFVREGKRVAHDEHGMGRYILATKDETKRAAKFPSPRSTSTPSSVPRPPSSPPSTSCSPRSTWTSPFWSMSTLRAASAPASTWKMPSASACSRTSTAASSSTSATRPSRARMRWPARTTPSTRSTSWPQYDLHGAFHQPALYGRIRRGLLPPHTNRELFPSSVQE